MPNDVLEESNEQLIESLKHEEAYLIAEGFNQMLRSKPYTTEEDIVKFRELFSPSTRLLIVALQATPKGYDEGRIHLFYRQLDVFYQSVKFPPHALLKDDILQLQKHLLLQARTALHEERTRAVMSDFMAFLLNDLREDKKMHVDPLPEGNAAEAIEEDGVVEDVDANEAIKEDAVPHVDENLEAPD
jgi:hypothetical protein